MLSGSRYQNTKPKESDRETPHDTQTVEADTHTRHIDKKQNTRPTPTKRKSPTQPQATRDQLVDSDSPEDEIGMEEMPAYTQEYNADV